MDVLTKMEALQTRREARPPSNVSALNAFFAFWPALPVMHMVHCLAHLATNSMCGLETYSTGSQG